MSSGRAGIIGSHEKQSVECDLMISAHSLDMIQYARSSYYCNDVFIMATAIDNWLSRAKSLLTTGC